MSERPSKHSLSRTDGFAAARSLASRANSSEPPEGGSEHPFGAGLRERPPAVAGQFYPRDRRRLEAMLDAALEEAAAPLGGRPVGLMAPHAGYAYCGRVLGEAWKQARGHRYDLIVILGTNHTVPGFRRVSVWTGGPWRTPLGSAPVDGAAARATLAADPADCVEDPRPHSIEHSVEVQVPFAQRLFPGVAILPVVVGAHELAALRRLGESLAELARERQALIVASSDLSHYPAKADAEVVDQATLAAVATLDPSSLTRTIAAQMRRGVPALSTCACGTAPILAAMFAARSLGVSRGSVVSYANSGDVLPGDSYRVVGYGAVAFAPEPPPASEEVRGASP